MKKFILFVVFFVAMMAPPAAKAQYFPQYYNGCYSTLGNCALSFAGGVLNTLLIGRTYQNMQKNSLAAQNFALALQSNRTPREVQQIHNSIYCAQCEQTAHQTRQRQARQQQYQGQAQPRQRQYQSQAQPLQSGTEIVYNFFSFPVHLYVDGKRKKVGPGSSIAVSSGAEPTVRCSNGDTRGLRPTVSLQGPGWIIAPHWLPDCRPQ